VGNPKLCRTLTEQGDLVRIGLRLGVSAGAQDPMRRGNCFDVAGLFACPLAFGERGLKAFEGVSDVLELAVQVIAMAIKEVLQAFEQICGEVVPEAARVAVGPDGVEAIGHQAAIAIRRTEQAPAINLIAIVGE